MTIDRKHPNNKHVVSVQLEEYEYHVFTEMIQVLKLNATDALKALIDQAICRYHKALKQTMYDAASERIFNDNSIEKSTILKEMDSTH